MRVVAVTQARMGSTRFPGKVLKQVAGRTLLEIHLERLQLANAIDEVIVATTIQPEDLAIVDVANRMGITTYQGSVNDVLDRFYQAVKDSSPDYIVRITSDCPLLDPKLIDTVIALAVEKQVDYCANILKETFPDGQDIEVFKFATLERAWREASLLSDREHVTPYIRTNADYNGGKLFKAYNHEAPSNNGHVRMTVDEAKDFEVISILIEELGTTRTWKEYADFILTNPKIAGINAHIIRNEGYIKSLGNDTKK
jgi:spore coat polysaccharide biosynthesis protein SpsF (cytidylyltransferase family)